MKNRKIKILSNQIILAVKSFCQSILQQGQFIMKYMFSKLPLWSFFCALFIISTFPLNANAYVASKSLNEACNRFEEFLLNEQKNYKNKLTSINQENTKVETNIIDYYVSDEALLGVFKSKYGLREYYGLAQLSPGVNLILFEKSIDKKIPDNIIKKLSSLTKISKTAWESKFSYIPEGYKNNNCEPLAGNISGKEFNDNVDRKFIRHYKFGKRKYLGESHILGCESWGTTNIQFRFYETFIPDKVLFKDQIIFVDPEYIGSATDDSFKFICDTHAYIKGKIIASNFQDFEGLTLEYLKQEGVEEKFLNENYSEKIWELQILRNILEGSELFY